MCNLELFPFPVCSDEKVKRIKTLQRYKLSVKSAAILQRKKQLIF